MVKLDHLSLPVSDWKRSSDWYVVHFGFRLEFEVPRGGRAGLGVAALQDDAGLTLFFEQVDGPVRSGQAAYTLQVDDVDRLYERLSGDGIAFDAAPAKQFWGYGAELRDPDGHRLYLYDEQSMQEKG
jgi:catechol 2,3-dioxygenase-like lactoylglutathione lyase family enzyme